MALDGEPNLKILENADMMFEARFSIHPMTTLYAPTIPFHKPIMIFQPAFAIMLPIPARQFTIRPGSWIKNEMTFVMPLDTPRTRPPTAFITPAHARAMGDRMSL